MSEHIDSNRLQTDLRYRFDYLSKFVQFNDDDIALGSAFWVRLTERFLVQNPAYFGADAILTKVPTLD